MIVNQHITNNIELIALTAISGLLFVDAFLNMSEYFSDGWFRFLLGIFLLTIGVVLFINRDGPSEDK